MGQTTGPAASVHGYGPRPAGHTTPSTTWDSYIHLFNEAKQADEAREQLDAELGSVLDGEAVIRRPIARPATASRCRRPTGSRCCASVAA